MRHFAESKYNFKPFFKPKFKQKNVLLNCHPGKAEVGAVEVAPALPHGEEHRAEDDVEREEEEASRDRDRHQTDVLHQLELDHRVRLSRRRRRGRRPQRGRGRRQGRRGLVAAVAAVRGGAPLVLIFSKEAGFASEAGTSGEERALVTLFVGVSGTS